MDALGHRPQDFLVPDRRDHLEIAFDDADDRRPFERRPVEFALADGRSPTQCWIEEPQPRRLRGAGKDDGNYCDGAPAARREREPER